MKKLLGLIVAFVIVGAAGWWFMQPSEPATAPATFVSAASEPPSVYVPPAPPKPAAPAAMPKITPAAHAGPTAPATDSANDALTNLRADIADLITKDDALSADKTEPVAERQSLAVWSKELKAIKDATPTFNDAGDTATYTIDAASTVGDPSFDPSDTGPRTITFKNTGGQWIRLAASP